MSGLFAPRVSHNRQQNSHAVTTMRFAVLPFIAIAVSIAGSATAVPAIRTDAGDIVFSVQDGKRLV